MKKLTLTLFVLLCIFTLSACNKSPKAQLAPVENVFEITAVNLPESYSTISNDIHVIGDRIGRRARTDIAQPQPPADAISRLHRHENGLHLAKRALSCIGGEA